MHANSNLTSILHLKCFDFKFSSTLHAYKLATLFRWKYVRKTACSALNKTNLPSCLNLNSHSQLYQYFGTKTNIEREKKEK